MKIPIRVYNKEQEDQGLKQEDCEELNCNAWINPFKIESYRESVPRELDLLPENLTETIISMDSGDTYRIYMTVIEFENLLIKHSQSNQ
jgi:hypothetical protein